MTKNTKNTTNNNKVGMDELDTIKEVMKVNIGDVPEDMVRVAFPPIDKKVALRPLWSDEGAARCMGKGSVEPKFVKKMDDLLDNFNDKILEYLVNSEKYDSADPSFKSSIKSELDNIKQTYMSQLSKPM